MKKERIFEKNTLTKKAKDLASYITMHPEKIYKLTDKLALFFREEANDDLRLALISMNLFINSTSEIREAWDKLQNINDKEDIKYIG